MYKYIVVIITLLLAACSSGDNYDGFWRNAENQLVTLDISFDHPGSYIINFVDQNGKQDRIIGSLNDNNILESFSRGSPILLNYSSASNNLTVSGLRLPSPTFELVTNEVIVKEIVSKQLEKRQQKNIDDKVRLMTAALEMYRLDKGRYPTNEEGLHKLVEDGIIKGVDIKNYIYSINGNEYTLEYSIGN